MNGGNYEHTRGLYEILAALRQRFPALTIENCSGGGHRLDFAMARLTDSAWMDDRSAPSAHVRRNLQGLLELFPAPYLFSYVMADRDEPIHGSQDIPLLVRSRMPGVVGLPTELERSERARVQRANQQFELAKALRPLQANAITHVLTPQRPGPGEWEVVQQVTPDGRLSLIFAYGVGAPESIVVRAARPAGRLAYQLRSADRGVLGRVRGADLIADGLEILRTPESASQVLVLEATVTIARSAEDRSQKTQSADPQRSKTQKRERDQPAAPSRRRPHSDASIISTFAISFRRSVGVLARRSETMRGSSSRRCCFGSSARWPRFSPTSPFPQYQDQGFSVFRTDNLFWDTFARYDAGWYHGIASQGYVFGAGGRNNLAFAPVYPMLMRAGGWLLGGRQQDFYFAGIVVSWLAFAAAMVMLYRLALLDLERSPALRAVMYAAAFPFAYFFGMVYSESVFLLALVIAVYGLRTRHWALAALAGAVMTATRVTGVMAVPGLAWVAWQAAGRDPAQRWQGVSGDRWLPRRHWRLLPLQLRAQRHAVRLVRRDHVLGLSARRQSLRRGRRTRCRRW